MIFNIQAKHSESGDLQVFTYDNHTNCLKNANGDTIAYPNVESFVDTRQEYTSFSPTAPLLKSSEVEVLKIQLGLSCNYACDYCSQRFVERPPETSKKDIEAFMENIRNLKFDEKRGLKIEFWGGEPFVYWKTLRPLVDALQLEFAGWTDKIRLSIVTNGSLLTPEINDWIIDNNISIGISHDGPGQYIRGPDPLDDPEQKKNILDLYNRLKSSYKVSFNAMLTSKNFSRKDIYDWFVNMTGDKDVMIGEGGIVDAYDEGGVSNSLQTKAQHFEFRKVSFADLFVHEGNLGFTLTIQKLNNFIKGLLSNSNVKYLGQKCGMDKENTLSIDLKGNVLTCQNTSSVDSNPAGIPHLSGHVSNMEDVKITTSTHWSQRPHCTGCPVLQLCQGSCMFLEGDLWYQSCANSYSDHIPLFALAIAKVSNGYIPVFIEGGELPDERRDIWGDILTHKEKVSKVIPIKLVAPTITSVNDIEVYTKTGTIIPTKDVQ